MLEHNSDELSRINREIGVLVKNREVPEDIGKACNPTPCQITGFDSHAMERIKERGLTLEDAQNYIDTAIIMFEQDGDRNLYLSSDGGSVLVSSSGELITAYSRNEFKKHTWRILKVVIGK
jgi:hypothetical protein